MIIDSTIKSKYDLQRPYFEFIQRYLDKTLMSYTQKNLYAYSSRIKHLDSICEKIETGRYSSWSDLDDIVGCVIIVPNLVYEANILEFLEKSFNKFQIKKKGSTYKCYDVFRFDSTRFIGTIKPESEDKRSEIHTIKFEIQIRSAFEHAWSVTTHDLAYKSDEIDWSILRLAAQLKASVEQLDMISLSAKEASKNITKSKWPEIDIKIEILHFLKSQFENGKIPNELRPKDFSRVVDNIFNLIIKDLSVWMPKKWLYELKALFKKINESIENLNKDDFPLSLSLYQIFYGIMLKEDLISHEIIKKSTFYRSASFHMIFSDLELGKIREFKI